MAYRTRINYTVAQKTEMWDRWQRGETLNAIGRVFDRHSSSILNIYQRRVVFALNHEDVQNSH
jgi:transposase, IS30 family